MKFVKIFSLCLIISLSAFANSSKTTIENETESYTGRVMQTGTNNYKQIVVTPQGAKKDVVLCRNNIAGFVEKLSDMVVTVTGHQQFDKSTNGKCFSPDSYQIETSNSGRIPLIGVLQKENNEFYVIDQNNIKIKLKKIGKALEGWVGKKVILDVKPYNSDHSIKKVVSYILHPEN